MQYLMYCIKKDMYIIHTKYLSANICYKYLQNKNKEKIYQMKNFDKIK